MKCNKHPQYKGIRRPKVDCEGCWKVYNELHKDKEENKAEELAEETKETIDIIPQSAPLDLSKDVEKEIEVKIRDVFDSLFKEFKLSIKDLLTIKYEHINVPLRLFNMKLLNSLEKDGWGYKDIYRGELAKTAGLKEDSVVLIRVKSDKWPEKPKFN